MKKKVLCLLLALAMLTTFMYGCKKTTPGSSSSGTVNTGKPDTSKKVELQFYMVGDAPKDLQLITDKVNEIALRGLNCTVKFNYTTWTDYTTKYNLLLSSGQPIDLLYTANWLNYNQLALKGAFKPLDDLLPKYAPKLYGYIPQDLWDQVKVKGKIYTIPSTYKEYVNDLIIYRKDLCTKYNLPAPDSFENLEKYLDGIHQNDPKQPLIDAMPVTGDFSTGFGPSSLRLLRDKPVTRLYGLSAEYDNPTNVTQYWGSQDFINDMKLYKRWSDKGYWSKNALSYQGTEPDISTGQCAIVVNGQNANKYNALIIKAKSAHPDWELGYLAYASSSGGVITPVSAVQNGYGIPKSAANPERALMFYEKLVLDKTLNQLTQYGIEGTHYKVENGYYASIGDASTSPFGREGMNGWAWRNPEFMLFNQSYDTIKEMFSEFDKVAKPDRYGAFAEDYSNYQTERAALATVITQYLAPLEAGAVADVDSGVKTFMDKAKAAGLEKIQAEFTKQWKAYCEEHGYK